MTTNLVLPAAGLAVTIAEARENLRVGDEISDGLVEAWIRGVTSYAEHETGRSILRQEWEVTLDTLPPAIRLLHPPIIEVISLKFFDVAGQQQQLDPQDYLVDVKSAPGWIVPAPGLTWPATLDRVNAVEVRFASGYGEQSSDTPDGLRLFILAKLVEQFDPAIRPERETVQATFIDSLLDRYKVYA